MHSEQVSGSNLFGFRSFSLVSIIWRVVVFRAAVCVAAGSSGWLASGRRKSEGAGGPRSGLQLHLGRVGAVVVVSWRSDATVRRDGDADSH